jgi:alkylhydroperoxidase/carboxymuconolactone decarboxylase family protein YurZ
MNASHLPDIYLGFRSRFPDLVAALDRLGQASDEAGPLDDRERRLVKLGLAIGSGASGAVKSNARRALAAGATHDEVLHVAALAVSTAGLPAAVAGYQWCLEVLEAA